MGLAVLIVGLLIFLATHVFVSMRSARAAAIARLGKVTYHGLFGLVSTVSVVLIAWGFVNYRAHGLIPVWSPPAFMHHITIGLMWFAVVLALAGYLRGHIAAWTKYPMIAAVKVWAFAHLLSNGDLGAILMFGGFLGWAVFVRIALKRRDKAEGIKRPVEPGWTNDIICVLLGTVLYLALGYVFHPVIIGVPVFGVGA